MKKLFSITTLFLLILTLSGCLFSNNSVEEEIIIEPSIVDYELQITFTDEYGFTTKEYIYYAEDFIGNLFDLLDDNFLIAYNETDFGNYIVAIEHLIPKVGAYISLSKNGEFASEGVETISFEDGDSFEFEVIWWDELEHAVDDAIQLFISNHACNYVNDLEIDYNVISALYLLGIVNEYVTTLEVTNIVDNSTLEYVNDYFKAIIKLQAVGVNADDLISSLNSIVEVGPYGQTAYGLIVLDSYEHMIDYSAYRTNAIDDLFTTTPFDLGLDAGGISLVALSNYTDELGVNDLITEFTEWVSSSQLDSGGLKTRDLIYGETTYLGIENAASMSQVILALLANGINPTETAYTKGDNNLVTRLLEFQTSTGSFTWGIGDEYTEDLSFSTPQAFLALVAYQTFTNTYNPVNPYNFK